MRELFVIAGRGSGKSRVVALLACCFAIRSYPRAPGEQLFVGVAAPDRRQSAITHRYITGLLRAVPELAALVEDETRESVTLSTGVVVEVITASTAAPRGRAYALFVVEEASFLPNTAEAADPDVELLRAVRPALARVPGSLLAVVGSPYARRGVLYDAWRAGDDADRIVVSADTLTLNPSFRSQEIARAFETDPISAASEYGRAGSIDFRSDVAGLLTDAVLAAVVPEGVRELAPETGCAYVGHFDAATGSGDDAAALAIARVGQPAALAVVRRWRPPFSPASVVREAAELCARYHVHAITIDRFAPGLVAELFRGEGVSCRVAERDTSASFLDLLALLNSGRVSLLDDPILLGELRRLERRPGAGRDHVGHPPRGHDDVAAAAAQALIAAADPRAHEPMGLLMPDDFTGGGPAVEDLYRRFMAGELTTEDLACDDAS